MRWNVQYFLSRVVKTQRVLLSQQCTPLLASPPAPAAIGDNFSLNKTISRWDIKIVDNLYSPRGCAVMSESMREREAGKWSY
ncbi:hypothetical protein BaRGS_00002003 [Batillaria attramentaria]|uniref:Uncharacterized protein n=1 Tax=Batillaria attramentaria TaxID=370345 RepID=A0ABD0M4B4_9CAEN